MSKTSLIYRKVQFKFLTNITLDQIKSQEAEYANKLQSCCYQHLLAVGTEKGKIHILDMRNQQYVKVLFGEPWISTLDNCRGVIWVSGISRSLFCIRIKDNKKIFHTNCDTNLDQYDGKILFKRKEEELRSIRKKFIVILFIILSIPEFD